MNDPTTTNTINTTVTHIAAALNEPNTTLLQKVVAHLGPERALDFLAQTQQLEAGEGLRTENGKRRRTPGGVFFYLVKHSLPPAERRQLWPPIPQKKKKLASKPGQPANAAPKPTAQPSVSRQPLTFEEAKPVIISAFKSTRGEATTVKVVLIDRPVNLQVKESYVAFTLKGKEPPSLPAGLPPAVKLKTPVYAVLVALKQWRKVEASIKSNPDDQVIIEGWPTIDPEKGIGIVWALSCKSVAMEKAGREKKVG